MITYFRSETKEQGGGEKGRGMKRKGGLGGEREGLTSSGPFSVSGDGHVVGGRAAAKDNFDGLGGDIGLREGR